VLASVAAAEVIAVEADQDADFADILPGIATCRARSIARARRCRDRRRTSIYYVSLDGNPVAKAVSGTVIYAFGGEGVPETRRRPE
jgi:hypothetical protein